MNSSFSEIMERFIIPSTKETLYMVFWSSLFTIILGLIIGVILYVTAKDSIKPMPTLYKILSLIVNIGRSIPFVILVFALFPLSKIIVGTIIGPTATIVPLTIASIPFFSRIIENALSELDKGVIEAATSFGASNFEIIFKVLIPETAPSIVNGISLTIISIIGYSAMAGCIGGGGLGDLAIRYGFIRTEYTILYLSLIVMVLLVQIVQLIGNIISKQLDKR